MGVRGARYDVWTDAGRRAGREFLIARDISDSMTWQILRCLQDQGWSARQTLHDPALGSPKRQRPRPPVVSRISDEDSSELSQDGHWEPKIV
jgi:hypothetical protein